MAYFTPSTKPARPRYDLLDKHEEHEIDRAHQEISASPTLYNRNASGWETALRRSSKIQPRCGGTSPLPSRVRSRRSRAWHPLSHHHRRRCLGENKAANWAWDITNFVFWIGIGHAGTMIAPFSISRVSGGPRHQPAAEAMTVFAVMCAGIYPAYTLAASGLRGISRPFQRQRHLAEFQESAALGRLRRIDLPSVSIMFWYVGLIRIVPPCATG